MDSKKFKKMKRRIKNYFATATQEEIEEMLERTNYSLYKTVGPTLEDYWGKTDTIVQWWVGPVYSGTGAETVVINSPIYHPIGEC